MRHHGLGIERAILVYGGAMAAFGLVLGAAALGWFAPAHGRRRHPNIVLIVAAALTLVVAGGADNISSIFRNTMVQAAVPDAIRGRLQGVFIVVVAGGPRLGALYAGDTRDTHHAVVPAPARRIRDHRPRRVAGPAEPALPRVRRRQPEPLIDAEPTAIGGFRTRHPGRGRRVGAAGRVAAVPTDAPATMPRPSHCSRRRLARAVNASVAVQFVLAGIIWGSSFLFMKVALEGLSPGQVAWSRLVLGALTLGLFVALRRENLPRSLKVWGHMTVLALSFCVVPFLLFSWAQQHVTSGLASIYNATTPIMTAVMAGLLFRVESLKAVQIAGILAGIMGVVVIIAPWQGLDLSQSLVAQFAILGATACYGFSLAYMRKFVSNTGMTALVFSFLNIGIAAAIMLRADAGRRAVARLARPLDHRQHPAARMPRHRRRVHLEPEHRAGLGADARVDGHLHHAGRRRRARASSILGESRSLERAGRAPHRLPRHPARSGPSASAATPPERRRGGRLSIRCSVEAIPSGQSCCSAPCRSSVMVTSLPTSTPPVSRAAFQVRPKSSRLMTVFAVAPAL